MSLADGSAADEAAATPEGAVTSDPPDDTAALRRQAEVLAELVDRHAAERRSLLEATRQKRLELDRVTRELARTRARLESVEQTLAEVRQRRSLRAATALRRLLTPLRARRRRDPGDPAAGAARPPGTRPSGTAAPAARPARPGTRKEGTIGIGEPLPRALASGTPAGYRAELLNGLATGAAAPSRVVAAAATVPAGDDPSGWPDAVVVDDPAYDTRGLPRHVVTVARIGDDLQGWLAAPWLDDIDVVLVRTPGVATAIAAGSTRAPVVRPDAIDGPADGPAVRDALASWAAARRFGILVQARSWEDARTSGDHFFARGLQRQLERRGFPTSVYLLPEWGLPATSREDVVLHLWGRYPHATRASQVNAVWILYHPELVTPELLARYDRVFVASDTLAARLAATSPVPVLPLHQATDPDDLRPRAGAPRHELLLIGNSRGTRRHILDDLGPTPRDLAVFGAGWEPDLLDPRYLRGPAVPHEELGAYYACADIVLNDHWPEAADAGLINNRVYDILAAGGFVISDRVEGIEAEFDGGVVTYSSPSDLAVKVDHYLGDPSARAAVSSRGRAAVLARHTFAHRVDLLLAELVPLLEEREA